MKNQLETQIEDVRNALGDLSICLQLALDDKDQFIKEYGSLLYTTFCSIYRKVNIDACKIDDMLDE